MYPRDTENTTCLHYLNEEPQVFFVELKGSKKKTRKSLSLHHFELTFWRTPMQT